MPSSITTGQQFFICFTSLSEMRRNMKRSLGDGSSGRKTRRRSAVRAKSPPEKGGLQALRVRDAPVERIRQKLVARVAPASRTASGFSLMTPDRMEVKYSQRSSNRASAGRIPDNRKKADDGPARRTGLQRKGWKERIILDEGPDGFGKASLVLGLSRMVFTYSGEW